MDDLFKHLRQFQTGQDGDVLKLKVPLPRTESGLVERHCPSQSCAPRIFQMGDRPDDQALTPEVAARTRRGPGGNDTVCPYCGTTAEDEAFISPRDREAAVEHVKWAAMEGIQEAFGKILGGMASDFNGRTRGNGGLISMSMEFKPGPRKPAPRPYRDDLLRTLTCDVCSRRYGVYAVGLFCPDCGASNVGVHFARELQLVRDQAALSRAAAEEGNPELGFRLLGNAHEDVLTAFETYLKTLYGFVVRTRMLDQAEALTNKKVVGNAFQNVERGRKLYTSLGIDLFASCSDGDMEVLDRNIQKRHVIGHNLGLADEAYVERQGAATPGTTVEITPDDITHFAEICASVIAHVVANTPELGPPPPKRQ